MRESGSSSRGRSELHAMTDFQGLSHHVMTDCVANMTSESSVPHCPDV